MSAMGADRTLLVIIGIAAAALQLLLGPALTFGDATPGFIVAAAVAVAALFPDERHYLFAFVMGLVADLLGGSPVGATAFGLLVAAFLLSMAFEAVGDDNLFTVFFVLLAGALAVELVFAAFLAAFGIVGFGGAIVHVALPCALYDALLALAVFALCRRFAQPRGGSGVTMSNVRFR